MEWWTLLLYGLGIWLFGFMTGTQCGMSAYMLKMDKATHPPQQPPSPQDMSALLQMMGQGLSGGQR